MILADFEDFRIDESLHQAKNVRVAAPLDLAEEALFGVIQECEFIDEGQSVRQKLLCRV